MGQLIMVPRQLVLVVLSSEGSGEIEWAWKWMIRERHEVIYICPQSRSRVKKSEILLSLFSTTP
jgi:hypothetical protein